MKDGMARVKKYIDLIKDDGAFDFLGLKDVIKEELEDINALVGASTPLRDAVLVAVLERWIETSKSMPEFDHKLKELVSTLLGAQGFAVAYAKGSVNFDEANS